MNGPVRPHLRLVRVLFFFFSFLFVYFYWEVSIFLYISLQGERKRGRLFALNIELIFLTKNGLLTRLARTYHFTSACVTRNRYEMKKPI